MSTFTEDYSPRVVGDTSGSLLCRCVDTSGNPYDLAGLDVSDCALRIKPENAVARDGAGSWTIVDASDGQVAYAWDDADVTDAGIVQVQATIPINGEPRHFGIKEILFERPL